MSQRKITAADLDAMPDFTILGGLAGQCEISPRHPPEWSGPCEPGVEYDDAADVVLARLGLWIPGPAADVNDEYADLFITEDYTTTHSALQMLNDGALLMRVPDASGELCADGETRAYYWYIVRKHRRRRR